jgi:hypothetical protein
MKRPGFNDQQEDARNTCFNPESLAVTAEGSAVYIEGGAPSDTARIRMITPGHRLVTLVERTGWFYENLFGNTFPVPTQKIHAGFRPSDLCLLPGGSMIVLDGDPAPSLYFIGPGGAQEAQRVKRVETARAAIRKGNGEKLRTVLDKLDLWAKYPKTAAEKYRLHPVHGAARSIQLRALPGMPAGAMRALEQSLGASAIGGEQEVGMAIQARVARALVRKEMADHGVVLPAAPPAAKEAPKKQPGKVE